MYAFNMWCEEYGEDLFVSPEHPLYVFEAFANHYGGFPPCCLTCAELN